MDGVRHKRDVYDLPSPPPPFDRFIYLYKGWDTRTVRYSAVQCADVGTRVKTYEVIKGPSYEKEKEEEEGRWR